MGLNKRSFCAVGGFSILCLQLFISGQALVMYDPATKWDPMAHESAIEVESAPFQTQEQKGITMKSKDLMALRKWARCVFYCLALAPLLGFNQASAAEEQGYKVHAQFGVYTHFGDSEDYEGPPILGNLELNSPRDWLFGLSLFNNSFGQTSQYIYAGKKWRLPKIQKYLHVKLTGGIVHGYVDEFEDKIPFNFDGWGAGIIPSIGFKKDRWAIDLVALGTAGLLLAVGYDIWDF